jgi:hypothetical protein
MLIKKIKVLDKLICIMVRFTAQTRENTNKDFGGSERFQKRDEIASS